MWLQGRTLWCPAERPRGDENRCTPGRRILPMDKAGVGKSCGILAGFQGALVISPLASIEQEVTETTEHQSSGPTSGGIGENLHCAGRWALLVWTFT